MSHTRLDRWPALFATTQAEPPFEVDDAFLDGIRSRLHAMLAPARGAPKMPWRDLTPATVAELEFKGLLTWLSDPEASSWLTPSWSR